MAAQSAAVLAESAEKTASRRVNSAYFDTVISPPRTVRPAAANRLEYILTPQGQQHCRLYFAKLTERASLDDERFVDFMRNLTYNIRDDQLLDAYDTLDPFGEGCIGSDAFYMLLALFAAQESMQGVQLIRALGQQWFYLLCQNRAMASDDTISVASLSSFLQLYGVEPSRIVLLLEEHDIWPSQPVNFAMFFRLAGSLLQEYDNSRAITEEQPEPSVSVPCGKCCTIL